MVYQGVFKVCDKSRNKAKMRPTAKMPEEPKINGIFIRGFSWRCRWISESIRAMIIANKPKTGEQTRLRSIMREAMSAGKMFKKPTMIKTTNARLIKPLARAI